MYYRIAQNSIGVNFGELVIFKVLMRKNFGECSKPVLLAGEKFGKSEGEIIFC